MLYRCTNRRNCGARRKLHKPIGKYKIRPVCKQCGSKVKADHAQQRLNSKSICKCDALLFPHRAGSSRWCILSKIEPNAYDYGLRFGFHTVTDWDLYCSLPGID